MRWAKLFKLILAIILATAFYCEFLVYYVVLAQCKWPELPAQDDPSTSAKPIKAVILADTHLLGPMNGHWFDKFVREWHMHRAFQTAVTIFHPEVIFILGDLFDEGHMVNDKYFTQYVERYHQLFYTPKDTRVISIAGNHDVGFHYRMHPILLDRFAEEYSNTGVHMYTIRDVHFVVINSMAMENDKCSLCTEAQNKLTKISAELTCMKNPKLLNCKENPANYSRPILMQHFPTYRLSDAVCKEHDSPKIHRFRENWEVLSKESTKLLGRAIHPRVAFSGHIHHYCRLRNSLGIPEYSVASFSWRNKINPSFLLAQFTPTSHSVYKCDMPNQQTNVAIYITILVVCLSSVVLNLLQKGVRFLLSLRSSSCKNKVK